MKEKIYTIPVMEAFREKCECSICYMTSKIEEKAVDFMMGASASYMEDHVRLKTNEIGFCGSHYKAMYKFNNSLGMALIIDTHLQQINRDLPKAVKSVKGSFKKSLFGKASTSQNSFSSYINTLKKSCYICDMVNDSFPRYIDTFFWLWKEESEMKQLVAEGNGFCLEHFLFLIEAAVQKLPQNDYAVFCDTVVSVQLENFKRLSEEVSWFVKKFDYRFTDEPWKNSKDSIPRSILKLSSQDINK